MLPCCDLCYEKYIQADGIVDEELLLSAVRRWRSAMAEKRPAVAAKRPLPNACLCECHRVDQNVMH